MSANRPCQIAPTIAPEVITSDRTCTGCGYSLKGLRISGNCPECGRPIKGRGRTPRYTDQLVHAPIAWLEVLSAGALSMFLSAAATIVMVITLLFVRSIILLVVLGGITTAWAVGVFLATRPRPSLATGTVNVVQEWRLLRTAARVSQCFWPLTVLLVMFSIWVYNNSLSAAAFYAAAACAGLALVVAVGGLAPTCALLAHLADWAEDSSLAQSLRGCAWTIGFCGLVITLAVLNAYTAVLGNFMGGVLAVSLIAMVFMPPGYFLFCLFRFQSMARWAVWNHIAAEAKLDRFRSQAASAARRSRGAASPQHTPPPPR